MITPPLIGFLTMIGFSMQLQELCEPAGPEDPAHWDYDCGIVVIPPIGPR